MRRRHLILGALGLLMIAVFTGLWLLRDRPRQQAEQTLSHRLGGSVSISRLTIEGLERIRLEGVMIDLGPSWPAHQIVIDHIIAEGPLSEINNGHFRSLSLSGIQTRIDLCGSRAPTPPASAGGATIAELSIEDSRIQLGCGQRTLELNVSGTLFELGNAPHGRFEMGSEAPRIQLAPDDSGPVLEGSALVLILELERGSAIHVTADLSAARLVGRSTFDLGDSKLKLDATAIGIDNWQVQAKATIPALAHLSLQSTILLDPWRMLTLSAHADTASLDGVLDALFPTPGMQLGAAELELTRPADGPLLLAATLPQIEVSIGGHRLCAEASVTGNLRSLAPTLEDVLHGKLTMSSCQPAEASPLLQQLLPVVATFQAGLSRDGSPRLSAELSVTSSRGGELEGRGRIATDAPHHFSLDWSWQGRPLAQLLQLVDVKIPPELQLAGRVGARGRVAGDRDGAHGRAELDTHNLEITDETGTWQLTSSTAQALVHWTGGEGLDLTLLDSPFRLQLSDSTELEGRLRGAGNLSIPGMELTDSDLVLDLDRLGRLEAHADAGVTPWRLHATANELDAWRQSWPLLNRYLPANDEISASLTIDGELTLGPEETTITAQLELANGAYSSNDGSRVIEDLEGHTELVAQLRKNGEKTVRGNARFGGAQLLWGVLYGDYSKFFIDLEGNGHWSAAETWQGAMDVAVDDLLSLELRSESAGSAIRWRGTARAPALESLWRQAIREPCAGSLGSFETVALSGGSLEATASGELGQESALEARINLSELGIAVGEDLSLDALSIELPLALRWQNGVVSGTSIRFGTLAFAQLAVGGLRVPATHSGLSVHGDSLKLEESLTIPLLGGRLHLASLGLTNMLSADRHLEASVELEGLRLEQVSASFDLPALEGRLDGHFPLLRLSPERLTVDGASELQLFGGSLILAEISGRDPLSRYPRIQLAMAWDGVDLAQLTQTFDFGRVSGIVEGEVENCELFQGVPISCAGWLRSTARKGIDQRISLKAVNNIAILGTGSGLGLLNRGIHRLIDAYPYESLGFSMDLQNDHFHLRGLARRGEAELFVKGRFPLRLDVVNAHPGTTVSFRSMLARLRQLDFATIRTEP